MSVGEWVWFFFFFRLENIVRRQETNTWKIFDATWALLFFFSLLNESYLNFTDARKCFEFILFFRHVIIEISKAFSLIFLIIK
jgi:hypothetical protein